LASKPLLKNQTIEHASAHPLLLRSTWRNKIMSDQDHSSDHPLNVSRRGFLKGIGIGTAAPGVVSAMKPVAEAAVPNANVRGPGETEISLKINKQIKRVNVEPRV